MRLFTGSGVAVATPFLDGKIDYDTFDRLIEWQIKEGSDAIIVAGTTGESAALTYDEKDSLFKHTVDLVNKRVPLIAASGTNNTKRAIKMSQQAQDAGVDAFLWVTPYYNKGNDRGLIHHFETIADNIDLPGILYNVPSRTGVNLTPDVVVKLAQHKNICGIKEASGDIDQIASICQKKPKDFVVYSGNDSHVTPVLSLGGMGVISATANIVPKDMHLLVKSFLDGDVEKSKNIQLNMLELVDAMFCEVNPAPLKFALSKMGFGKNDLRLPLAPVEKSSEEKILNAMKNYKLI